MSWIVAPTAALDEQSLGRPITRRQVIEFDRNPNALRDEILVDHSWALGEDGALAVPMDRWNL